MPRTKDQFDVIREATKQKISAAGLKLFAHKGLDATSIQDIASEAGISAGLLYHYYKSKEELFVELVETAIHAALEGIHSFFDLDLPPAEKIRLFTREVIADIGAGELTSQYYMLMILSSLTDNIPEKAAAIREAGYEAFTLLADVVTEGQAQGEVREGDPRELALIYFSTIQGLAVYKSTLGTRFASPSAELVYGLLLPC
jgi:AcrR family transcriptional regulator